MCLQVYRKKERSISSINFMFNELNKLSEVFDVHYLLSLIDELRIRDVVDIYSRCDAINKAQESFEIAKNMSFFLLSR